MARTQLKHEWSAYGRGATLELLDGYKCDVCGQHAPVLAIDTSDEEYGAVKLCHPCIPSMFTNA